MEGGQRRQEAHDDGIEDRTQAIASLRGIRHRLLTICESYTRNRPCQHILYEYGVYNHDSRGIRVHTGSPILS